MISYADEPGSPVVEIRISGAVTAADLKDSISRLRDDFEQAGKTRVLEIIEHFTGMEPGAIWTDLKLGVLLAQSIDRVALVADQAWIRAFAHVGKLFTHAEICTFDPAHLAEARSWIGAPASGTD